MERRSFIAGISALIGGIAIEKAVPLGRVWSFPKEIKCLNATEIAQYNSYPAYEAALRKYVTSYSQFLSDNTRLFMPWTSAQES